jgi:hypothetical protein
MRKEKNNYRQQISIRPNLSIRDKSNPARPASGETCNADAFQYPLFGVGEAEIQSKYYLKILYRDPIEIWPSLPATILKNESRGADLPGYLPKRSIYAKLFDEDNNPVKGKIVRFETKFIVGSGGHTHNGNGATRELPLSLQGKFYSEKGGVNPIELVTDNNGIVRIDSFIASEVSGLYLIKASMREKPDVMDTLTIKVRVPGLAPQSLYYITLPDSAATDLMCTFDQTDTSMYNKHASPYWMKPTVADSLFAAITDFYLWSRSEEGGRVPIRVSLNDASLELGGAFEYPGTWAIGSDHCFHRVGCSIDINNRGIDSKEKRDNLFTFLRDYGGIKYPEPQIHFGFNHQK